MKEIIAIIRPAKVDDTKKALEATGIPAMTSKRVMGKGKLPVNINSSDGTFIMQSGLMAKRLIIIEAKDEDVDKIITIITIVNSTGTYGDGRIFVLPVESSRKIHTGERVMEV